MSLPKEFKRKSELLTMVDGLLTYSYHGNCLIVAPKNIRSQIMIIAHSHFLGGHFGVFKTHR